MTLFSTENLKIETILLTDDLHELIKIHNCPETMKWIPIPIKHWNYDDLHKKYAKNEFLYPLQLGFYKISLHTSNSTTIIGEVLLLEYTANTKYIEIGYILYKEYWRKGYGTELLEGIEYYIRKTHSKQKIVAQLYEENLGSRRLLEKMGYKQTTHELIAPGVHKLIYQKDLD